MEGEEEGSRTLQIIIMLFRFIGNAGPSEGFWQHPHMDAKRVRKCPYSKFTARDHQATDADCGFQSQRDFVFNLGFSPLQMCNLGKIFNFAEFSLLIWKIGILMNFGRRLNKRLKPGKNVQDSTRANAEVFCLFVFNITICTKQCATELEGFCMNLCPPASQVLASLQRTQRRLKAQA